MVAQDRGPHPRLLTSSGGEIPCKKHHSDQGKVQRAALRETGYWREQGVVLKGKSYEETML